MPEIIEIPVWVKRGSLNVRRDCLEPNDPDQTYNWMKTNYPDVNPEDYGIKHPLYEKYNHLTRSDLIQRIIDLEYEIIAKEFYGE